MDTSEPKWVNSFDIQYGVNSLRVKGLQISLKIDKSTTNNINKCQNLDWLVSPPCVMSMFGSGLDLWDSRSFGWFIKWLGSVTAGPPMPKPAKSLIGPPGGKGCSIAGGKPVIHTILRIKTEN